MPKLNMPILPEGSSEITSHLSVHCSEDRWVYFAGMMPVFTHAPDDLDSFRMYTSQLYCDGHCKQTDIIRVFGVSKNSVKRSVSLYREGGISAFFKK